MHTRARAPTHPPPPRYELFLDDLPIWGFVGELRKMGGDEKAFIYTHKTFDVAYNKDRIIHVRRGGSGQGRAQYGGGRGGQAQGMTNGACSARTGHVCANSSNHDRGDARQAARVSSTGLACQSKDRHAPRKREGRKRCVPVAHAPPSSTQPRHGPPRHSMHTSIPVPCSCRGCCPAP